MGGAGEADVAVSKVLEKKAKEKGTIMTSIAYVHILTSVNPRTNLTLIHFSLAYVMHKTPNVFPIVGGRKTEHLKGNIDALSIKLTPEDIEDIEDAHPFNPGFPLNFLFMGQKTPSGKGSDVFLTQMSTHLDVPERPRPVEPREKVGE